MSLQCDLCKKPLVKGRTKWINAGDKDLCLDCIKTCKEIMRDPKVASQPIVYLNEYKEMKEMERCR